MRKKIVYLDDHILYQSAVIKLTNPKHDRYIYIPFQHPDNALRYIINSIDTNSRIDLIMTDYNHLGLTGCEFAQEIRKYETVHSNNPPIPIILLSFVDPSHEYTDEEVIRMAEKFPDKGYDYYKDRQHKYREFQKAVENGLFSAMLGKNSDSDVIIATIESLFL